MTKFQMSTLAATTGEANIPTINENLRIVDAVGNLILESVTEDDTPTAPGLGMVWAIPLVPASGVWIGHSLELAIYTADGWHFVPIFEGCHATVLDEDALRVWDGAAWTDPDFVKRATCLIRYPQTGDSRRIFYALGDCLVTRVVYGIGEDQNTGVSPAFSSVEVATSNSITIANAWANQNAGEEFIGTIAVATFNPGQWLEVNLGTVTGAPSFLVVQVHYIENVSL